MMVSQQQIFWGALLPSAPFRRQTRPLRARAMKLKDLEGAIQQITTFQDPDYRLEQ